jgi:ubiquinone/menaquinone biosynthesis C-methylase UbiE
MQAQLTSASQEIEKVDQVRYAPWLPESLLVKAGRSRAAAIMLHRAGVFPQAGDPCLEVGFGWLGWLGTLLTWGVRERDLHGIDLDPVQVNRGREVLPLADFRVGDASNLPWESNRFRLVVASTLFTSLLDQNVRQQAAGEITRVLADGGALLWYDFAVNSPRNPAVRKVSRRELQELFPGLTGEIWSVTLAPPLARLIAPRSWALATLMEAIPLLRTHLLAVLVKRC